MTVTPLETVSGPVALAFVPLAISQELSQVAELTLKMSSRPLVVSPVAAVLPRKYPAPPPIDPQAGEEPAYPSNSLVVELYLNIPSAGEPSHCAVVPLGIFALPVAPVLGVRPVPDSAMVPLVVMGEPDVTLTPSAPEIATDVT